jgi:hypothetical protein
MEISNLKIGWLLWVALAYAAPSCAIELELPVNSDEIAMDINSGKSDYLFITNPNDLKDMATVTYFIDNKPSPANFEVFYKFSKIIGRKNGGVYINYMTAKALIPQWFSQSNCNFQANFFPGSIIFEDKINGKCYYFSAKDMDWLVTILQDIKINLSNGNYDKMHKAAFKHRTKQLAEEYIKRQSNIYSPPLMVTIFEFIDYIIEAM